MSKKNVFLPRDCYSAGEVSRLLGSVNAAGELTPVTRTTLWKRRLKGHLPYVKFGPRIVMYPRELIEAMLRQAPTSVESE